ncbi:glycerol-3-phosphate acyltransferase [Lapidilactobacillus bayanensis]|uniref:glycerol-3-phosphate acyltransferase n=1 Tax=Lapidilactobacillus bayanensis TaxID=2485998 RepID=UPI000F76EFE0|nr:glycerol-3-phosphate acyltransferase [Lapidilactobacillus bayanensis]
MWTEKLYCLLIGYGFGNFVTAYVVSYWRTRQKPTEIGSGNPGTANIGAVLGKKYGILTLCGDLLKTILAVLICQLLFPDLGNLAILYAGIGTTLGHNFPAWQNFRGGKGVAVSVILVLLFNLKWGVLSLLIALAVMLVTQNLTLPGIVIWLSYAVIGFTQYNLEVGLGFTFLMLLSLFSFRHDLADLIHGRAKKVDWLKKFRHSRSVDPTTTDSQKRKN